MRKIIMLLPFISLTLYGYAGDAEDAKKDASAPTEMKKDKKAAEDESPKLKTETKADY